jgi:transposase
MMQKGGEKVLSQIEEVSMNMTGNYKSLVRKLCPNAEVTVDIFPREKIVLSELN